MVFVEIYYFNNLLLLMYHLLSIDLVCVKSKFCTTFKILSLIIRISTARSLIGIVVYGFFHLQLDNLYMIFVTSIIYIKIYLL